MSFNLPNTCSHNPISIVHKNHPHIQNLDISRYSLSSIYEMFGVFPDTLTIDDLKVAKRRVLMTHPDKSHMPTEYFQFYTKALQVLVDDYARNHTEAHYGQRMKDMQNSGYKYAGETEEDIALKRQYQKTASGKEFIQNFNRVFETEMRAPVVDNNSWFRSQEDEYGDSGFKAKSQSDMGRAMQAVKQRQQAIIVHRGIQEYQTSHGSAFYEDTRGGGDTEPGQYIAADPFAKLKYDDLRRVHKDETVLSVGESDYDRMPKYRNVDEYNRARDAKYDMCSEEQALNRLREAEAARVARIRELQKEDLIRGAEYERKQEEARRMIFLLK